ncbi:MAG: hypothetical protein JWO46_1489 [Nocardioidaceae bacterium]|nr:hypothetical protein [Nocardioidaceae bacterium]
MISKSSHRVLLRAAGAGLFTVLLGLGGAAFADTPSNWEDSPHVSGFQFLLVLFLIPLGIGLVITVLTILPSLIKGSTGEMVVAEPQPDKDVAQV